MYCQTLRKYSVSIVFVIILLISPLANAKSLYVVEHRGERKLIAFEILEDQLLYQNKIELPYHGLGPRDIACDEATGTLFITYEQDSNYTPNTYKRTIEVFNTSLIRIQEVVITGQPDGTFSGIVYDAVNQQVLVSDEAGKTLWIFDFDPETQTLDDVNYDQVTLGGLQYGPAGLAIKSDPGNSINYLYVSDFGYGKTGLLF